MEELSVDNNQPIVFDIRPKRRKAKDNPYELSTTGAETDHPHYYLAFTDGNGIRLFIEINELTFRAFDHFELDDLSQMNKMDRHYEHSEQSEFSINKRSAVPQADLEEVVIQKAEVDFLHKAITKLPSTQRRRLMLYYFFNLTYAEIAKQEGCSLTSVRQSVKAAERNLKKWLDDK